MCCVFFGDRSLIELAASCSRFIEDVRSDTIALTGFSLHYRNGFVGDYIAHYATMCSSALAHIMTTPVDKMRMHPITRAQMRVLLCVRERIKMSLPLLPWELWLLIMQFIRVSPRPELFTYK